MTRTVLYFVDSDGFGGAEQMLLHVMRGLDRQRWQPVLFHHPEPGVAPLLEEAERLDVRLRAVPRMPLGKEGATKVWSFGQAVRTERPAVFHANLNWPLSCKYGLVGAMLARVPAIVATVQLFRPLPYGLSARIQQRLLATGVHRYIAVSQDLAQRLHQTFAIPERKIEIVHNAIPEVAFKRPADRVLRSSLSGSGERPLVLTVARLVDQKGHRYLLEAASQLPEALFVLVGDGPNRTELEAQVRAQDIEHRVRFLGYREDIADLLAVCDLFVLPSLYEGLPLSILEAMAAGKPVITTDIGGVDEAVIHGKTGLLVPPGDAQALTQAIRLLLDNPSLAQQLAAAGHDRFCRNFSVDAAVSRVAALYAELLDGDGA